MHTRRFAKMNHTSVELSNSICENQSNHHVVFVCLLNSFNEGICIRNAVKSHYVISRLLSSIFIKFYKNCYVTMMPSKNFGVETTCGLGLLNEKNALVN